MAKIDILKQSTTGTIVRLDFDSEEQMNNIYVMSGRVIEQGELYIILHLMQNDSLLINNRVVLWWNHKKRCFVRQ